MTKAQIEAILERVRTWPADRQNEAATILLLLEPRAGDQPEEASDEFLTELLEAEAEADRGEFVPEEEMKAYFARYR